MKTRQEMVYDFMVALASSSDMYREFMRYAEEGGAVEFSEYIRQTAEDFADEYLRGLA